jgi:hypothetical protein
MMTGPPKASLGQEKKYILVPAKSVPAKNLNIKSEKLTLNCRVAWGDSETVNVYI